ncbi:MAG: type II secretion system protein [Candidatus Margulisbacteria bacterium]|nr:type II secretion system protein [Candidatus Margulisiibacteriota bacterium]
MRKGFSLIELLIALSIMALLGTLVIPNIKKVQTKSYQITSEINLKTFQSSLENYYVDNNIYPVGQLTASDLYIVLKNSEHLNSCPINPYYKNAYSNSDVKGKITYSSSSGDDYSLVLYGNDGQTVQLTLNKI